MKTLILIIALWVGPVLAQQSTGTLKGQVLDELGGALVSASVFAADLNGVEQTVTTNDQGLFVFNGLAPGKYKIRVAAPGFAGFETTLVEVVAGRTQQLNITLQVALEEQKVTVNSDRQTLNTEPENNLGAIVIKGPDLDALPDDPDDLLAALQALAGPSAGPNGGQIFIDGFSGGRLPPLASIREIRINANPFSAEYDRMGFGRIEILTKPGTDKFRGQASFNFNDNAFNSRNPFAPDRPPFLSRQYGGNLSGPISKKKASFFLDFEKRDISDEALINATILDPNLTITPFSASVPTPNRRTTISPRIDYQINPRNTLVGRYTYTHSSQNNAGVNTFSLASRAYDTTNTEQTAQLTETATLSKSIVNETRFQFIHQVSTQTGDDSTPTINVLDAFQGGGAGVGQASNSQNHFELQNNTSVVIGPQTLRFGVRVRHVRITDIAPQNFGGTWTFAGGFAPQLDANNEVVIDPTTGLAVLENISSIERYRRTLVFAQQGLTPQQSRVLGGGATQFSVAAGTSEATVSQTDFGAFVQDDWKLRPNLTINLGLRYENQDNISSNLNLAPRVGFAWSPDGARQQAKTVVRGGFGIFYDRISDSLTLTAHRLNGMNQQQFIVSDSEVLDLFPTAPSLATLTSFATPITIYQLAQDIRTPYTMQSVISVEHQFPAKLKVAVSYINARSLHLLRTRAVNAPLPGTFVPGTPARGVRPTDTNDNIFEYDSSGRFNQNQLIINVTKTLKRNSSLIAYYVLAKADSDTDGSGTFPANSSDLSGEYGRSSLDIRNRFVLIGNFHAPWGLSFSPMIIFASGTPFNITIGRDLNGDTVFSERPAFATDLTKPGVVFTRWGAFDPNPTLGAQIIPRNFGTGPDSLTTRLGISKTFGFGNEKSASSGQNNRRGGDRAGVRGPLGLGGVGGGSRGGGGGRGGGFSGGGGDSGKRYNLTFSLNIQNPLNHANLGKPDGNLSSPFFGLSTASAGNFGGFGGAPGSSAYDRRIDAQVRFSF